MTTFYVAGNALINKDGKYLVLQRSKLNDYMPFKWDIPGGGVKPGETVEEALIREVAEETTLRISINRLIYVYTNRNQLPVKQTFQVIYACDYCEGEVKLNPSEHENYNWLPFEDIKNLDAIHFVHALVRSDTLI